MNGVLQKGGEMLKRYLGLAILVILGCKASGQWLLTNQPEGCIVHAVAVSGTTLLAGTGGGVFVSINSGASWRASELNNLRVYSFHMVGANLFAATADAVYRSTNNGTSWIGVENGMPGYTPISSLASAGTNLFAGTYSGIGVYLSTDYGTTWSAANTGLPNAPVLSLGVGATNLYAGTGGAGVYLSTNQGMSWTPRNNGLTNLTVHSILANGTNLFAGTDGGLFLSTDNGTTWTAPSSALTSLVVYTIVSGGTSLFAGTGGGAFLSTDDGRSWTSMGLTNYAVYALLVSGASLLAGTGGGVFLSTDNRTSWKASNTGLIRTWSSAFAIDASDSNTATISVRPTSIFQTVDGGSTWREMLIGEPREDVTDISMADGNHIWLCTDHGRIYGTTDGGVSWTVQFYDTSKTKFFNYIKMFDLYSGVAEGDGPPGARALVLKTTDGGDHWTSVPNSLEGSSGSIWQRIDFVNPEVGYFFVSGFGPQALFKTTDGGVMWSQTNYPAYAEVIKFYDQGIGLAIPRKGSVYRTLDGGTTWELFTSPHTGWGNDIEFVPGDPLKVWMTDNSKLYFSTDTGKTWTAQPSVAGGRDIIFLNDKYGWLLGDNGVLYRTTTGGLVEVIDHSAHAEPETFSLHQNYPNPFNPSTTIEFSLSHSGYVTLKIFNLLGAEVATVVARDLAAGRYTVDWDAAGLPSGVYLYRLVAGSLVDTRKMVLMK
jgi:photosystem II stability/assembly factor-like uncharacterized protein